MNRICECKDPSSNGTLPCENGKSVCRKCWGYIETLEQLNKFGYCGCEDCVKEREWYIAQERSNAEVSGK